MPEETVLIQPVAVVRDEDGWWDHPDLPDFDEDYAAFKAWITEQRLVLQQWHMEADIDGHHPYDDGECHCLGWNPVAPAPEWFMIGIFDTEDGPCVSWARRELDAMTNQPKGGMCCACQHARHDCSTLPFKAMPPIQRDISTVIVKCTDFKRQT